MKQVKYILVALVTLLATQAVVAQSFNYADLQGKTWTVTSGREGVDALEWTIKFNDRTCITSCKDVKNNETYSYCLSAYLSPNIPQDFLDSEIGKNTSGHYLLLRNTSKGEAFDTIEIISLTSEQLILKAINGHAITYYAK